jgi:hypothetical protein
MAGLARKDVSQWYGQVFRVWLKRTAMARKLRVEYPGAIYHVMNRGDRNLVRASDLPFEVSQSMTNEAKAAFRENKRPSPPDLPKLVKEANAQHLLPKHTLTCPFSP